MVLSKSFRTGIDSLDLIGKNARNIFMELGIEKDFGRLNRV